MVAAKHLRERMCCHSKLYAESYLLAAGPRAGHCSIVRSRLITARSFKDQAVLKRLLSFDEASVDCVDHVVNARKHVGA